MSLLLLVAVAGVVGYKVGRWWVAALPVALGLAVAGVVSVGGGSLQDTPLPFVVGASVIAAFVGLVAGRRLFRI